MSTWTKEKNDAYLATIHKQDRSDAFKHAWDGRCQIEDNWNIAAWERNFYTIKALICLCLHRNKKPNRSKCGFILFMVTWGMNVALELITQTSYADRYHDVEDVAVAAWGYWSATTWIEPDNGWKELVVGYGLFQNWYYQIISNSNY